MEQANPTGDSSGASTLDRLETFLSAEDAPKQEDQAISGDDQPNQAEDAQPEPEPAKADEPEQESETPNEYQLSDLAKLLGAEESMLDVDDDGNILVKTKVDGQEGRANFADLLKSYQLQAHVDKQVRDAAEDRKALQAQRESFQQQMQVQQAVIDMAVEVKSLEANLAQYQRIDWDALIESDPQQAIKLDRQYRELQQQHFAKSQEVERAQFAVQRHSEEQRQAMLQAEHQALLKYLPEWADEASATKEKQLITADLKARGFSDAEIKGLSDHKALLVARDAMLYRQQQAAKTVTEKQVRAAPKIIKPGSANTGNRDAQKVQNLRTAVVKSSGAKNAVVEYLLATGKV